MSFFRTSGARHSLTFATLAVSLCGARELSAQMSAPSPAGTPQALPLKLAPRPTTDDITTADLMTRMYIFADDSMMGRRVATEGHLKATAYLEREVRRIGLVPAGDSGTYFQNLPVFARTLPEGQSLSTEGTTFSAWKDYVPRDNWPTARSTVDAPVVYGGVFGDTANMISRTAASGKFVVLTVPNGRDGKPGWQANR